MKIYEDVLTNPADIKASVFDMIAETMKDQYESYDPANLVGTEAYILGIVRTAEFIISSFERGKHERF